MKKGYPRYYLIETTNIAYYIARSYDDIWYRTKNRNFQESGDFSNEDKLLKSPDFIREIPAAELALMEF